MNSKPEPARLHLLTFENLPEPPTEPCDGGYSCCCSQCDRERAERVNHGIRADRSNPFRSKAA